jgi:hypothetical protein
MTKKEYKTFQGALSSDPSLNVAHKAAAKFGAFLGRTLGPTGSTRQKLLGSPTVTGAIGKGIVKGAGVVKKVFKEEDSAKYRFKQKLNERRHLQKEDALETAKDVLIPGRTAYREYQKGNYGQAAIEAGIDAASIAAGAVTGGLGYAAIKGIKAARAARKASTATKRTTAGTATNTAAGAAGAATARTAAKTATKTGRKGAGRNRLMRRGATGAGLGAGLAAAGGGGGGRDNELGTGPKDYQFSLKAQTSRPQFQRTSSVENPLYNVRTTSAWNQAQQTVREEQAFDVVRIIQEQNLKEAAISINGNTMMINSLMADKINTLYESLNEENKEKMVSLLNESTDSFKKILDFAVRQ